MARTFREKGCALLPAAAILTVMITVSGVDAQTPQSLPSYNIDRTQTSVSGVSSGGYMAQQMHIAFSNDIMGAGIIAGGPYYCARDSVWIGLYGCMETYFGDPPVDMLVSTTRLEAAGGAIDDPANLRDDKVYLFYGEQDSRVTRPVMDALQAYYRNFLPVGNIRYVTNPQAEHAMITEDYGSQCGAYQSPYINDCDIDVAGEILKQIYGPLNDPVEATGDFIMFRQSEFGADQARNSLDKHGYAYIPGHCAQGEECKLHVVFHGCNQRADKIGDQFYRRTGYNEWAEANNIVVLYPQVADIPLDWLDFQHSNPQGCWDWWGYSGDDYHRKTGPQMVAVKAMIDRVSSGAAVAAAARAAPAGRTATIYEHVVEERAFRCGEDGVCAAGTGREIGSWMNPMEEVTLQETEPGSYEPVAAQ